jgi:hypothetical protein
MTKTDLSHAIEHALCGRWTQAHEVVQRDEESELACWIHAVLHRQEGDLPNARYWYSRCGRELAQGMSPEEELRNIREALGARS